MRLLVVEDDPRLSAVLARGLRENGYAVDRAADGGAALEHLHNNEYDAVVLDVMIPGIDGMEVCRRLRAERAAVPVLMLTARDSLDDRVRGLDAPRTRRYLIEDYTITYAPSASSIRFLRDKETPVKGKALVIGAPAGVSSELPGAMREAMMVGTRLHSVPMVEAAAKESLPYQLKGDVDLVHIAAHGFYEADTPLFSRLALAEGDGSGGSVEVHEILSDVDLTGVNLVVLSACQTALGDYPDPRQWAAFTLNGDPEGRWNGDRFHTRARSSGG